MKAVLPLAVCKYRRRKKGVIPSLCRNRRAGKLAAYLSRAGTMNTERVTQQSESLENLVWHYDVAYIEKLPFTEEEQFFLLDDLDFQVPLQVAKYLQTVRNGGNLDEYLEQSSEDLRHYAIEYLLRSPVIFYKHEVKKIGENFKVTTPLYAGQPIDENVSSIERDGAPKHANTVLTSVLITAPVGSLFVATSPPGWSGYEAEYKTSQTYVFCKTTLRDIEAVTIRSDMTLEQNEELLGDLLGVDWPDFGSQRERIKAIAESVIPVELAADSGAAESIALHISGIIGEETLLNEVMDEGGEFEKRFTYTIEEVLSLLGNEDSMFDAASVVDKVIADYADWVRNHMHGTSEEELLALVVETGKTVLRLLPAIEGKSGEEIKKLSPEALARSRAEQATRTGCVGGGVSRKKHKEGEVIHCVFCPACKQTVSVKIVGGSMVCMNCGAKRAL